MKSHTKFFTIFLLLLVGSFVGYYFYKQNLSILKASSTIYFDFGKVQNNAELENIVQKNIKETKGNFAVYIEELPASPSAILANPKKYVLNEKKFFPSASLYKLILIATVMKEVEAGGLKLDDTITGSKSDLTAKLGNLDFGYENMPEKFTFTVAEALERIGRISDNFAAIMLTDRLRKVPQKDGEEGLLMQMAKEIGMQNTDFMADPVLTTASDVGIFFKALYMDQIISSQVSAEIKKILDLNQINDRIPANLPKDVKVIHKTGELSRLRHDAGIILPPNLPNTPSHPYLLVLLSKDLEFEDEGVEVLANISKGVWDYFNKGNVGD